MRKLKMSFDFSAKNSWSKIFRFRSVVVPAIIVSVLFSVIPCFAQSGASADLPSETPAKFKPVKTGFDYASAK